MKKKVGGKNTSVACIGPAGENMAYMACIMNDEHRAAGSKKLKAIVVSGEEKVPVAEPDKFKGISKRCPDAMRENAVTGEGLPT